MSEDLERGEPDALSSPEGRLSPSADLAPQLARFVDAVRRREATIDALLPLLAASEKAPLPGRGATLERFSLLASVAAADVTAGRVLEPHLDALAILDEARVTPPVAYATWGVFAAESPSDRLVARHEQHGWRVSGVKPWCSLGARLDAALVTAYIDPSGDDSSDSGSSGSDPSPGSGSSRRLFAVRLQHDSVHSPHHTWVARGLSEVDSGPLRFDATPAQPVGADDWYLSRPGFEWGGIGVAATWWGGAVPLCTAIAASARAKAPSGMVEQRIGALWQAMFAARTLIERAAALIDLAPTGSALSNTGTRSREEWAVIAHAVRGATALAVDDAVDAVRDILGPAALCTDESIARRVADLQTYTAQYHRLRDPASLGRRVIADEVAW